MVTEKMKTQISDEMLQKASDVYASLSGMANKDHLRKALEAALSTDAEPVAIYKGNSLFDCGDGGHHNIELLRLIPANTPLYTAPPAPSVAVKAIAPAGCVEEWWQGDEVAYLRDKLKQAKEQCAIKPIEWNLNDSWNVSKTVIGTYVVRPCLATKFAGQWLLRRAQHEDSDKTLYASEDEAKAAAQADYEARIRSALSAQAQDVAGLELRPHEPTKEMLAAAMKADQDGMPASMKTIWMFMWSAYTASPAAKQEGKL